MRILAETATNRIVQVTMDDAGPIVANGLYAIDAPEASLAVLGNATVVDAALLASLYGRLAVPGFPHVQANPLVLAADLAKLDLSGATTIGGVPRAPRFQTGKAGAGMAPNMTALLPANTGVSPARPGMLQSATIDVSAIVPAGVSYVMPWWTAWTAATSHDVNTSWPDPVNQPAVKALSRLANDAATLRVFLSNDDGASWVQCHWMQPAFLGAKGTDLRICFLNDDPDHKVHLLGYALLHGTE